MYELNQENIDKITIEDWKELIDLIPDIEKTNEFGTLVISSTENENYFPFMDSSEIVDTFIKLVCDKNMVQVFDWMEWKEGQDILEKGEGDYSEFGFITLVKLITTIVRNDRFCEGYLVHKFEDGTILKILNRVKFLITK